MSRALNPAARVRVERVGAEAQPVIVIDDALADPAGWRDHAAMLDFAPIGPHYPGIRAAVPPRRAQALRDDCAPLIERQLGVAPAPPVLEAFYSIVTTPPSALAPIQRLPHVDGVEPARIAVLVYLSGAETGGTAFYRQRGTGFETVGASRYAAFRQALDEGIARHGVPDPGYIAGDTALYERTALFDAAPNRALIYRSNLLHCAAIPDGLPFSADPLAGRLSINLFLFDG